MEKSLPVSVEEGSVCDMTLRREGGFLRDGATGSARRLLGFDRVMPILAIGLTSRPSGPFDVSWSIVQAGLIEVGSTGATEAQTPLPPLRCLGADRRHDAARTERRRPQCGSVRSARTHALQARGVRDGTPAIQIPVELQQAGLDPQATREHACNWAARRRRLSVKERRL